MHQMEKKLKILDISKVENPKITKIIIFLSQNG